MSDILVGYFTASKQLNQLTIANHGLINGDTVRFALGSAGNTLPAPLLENVWCYVVSATSDTFKVSLTSDGTPIVLTNEGTGSNEAWSPSPTVDVWVYEMLTSELKEPLYAPDVTEVNYYAQRGWELKSLGQVAGVVTAGGRFWYLMQKKESTAPVTRSAPKGRKKSG